MAHSYRPENQAGFTLMELLVSIGISMVILGSITGTFISQTRTYNAQEQVNEMQQNARAAMDIMTREIMLAGYKPRGTESFNGVTYSTAELRIKANLNGYLDDASGGDATINDNSEENIVYTFDSANKQLKRGYGSNTAVVLANNISAFTFSYLDSSGAGTTTTANIRQVAISITAQTTKPDPNLTTNGGYRSYNISTVITPPNLAY